MFSLEELNKIYECIDVYESNLYNANWDAIKKEVALIKKIQWMALEEICRIEKIIIKENTPKEDKIYSLVDSTNKKSIVNGNSWNESEVKNND